MANFEKKKIDLSSINAGVRFENGDVVTADAINAPIEASAYAQELAEQAVGKATKKYYLHEIILSGSKMNEAFPYLRIYILNTSNAQVNEVNDIIRFWTGHSSIPLLVRFTQTAGKAFIDFFNVSTNYTPIYVGRSGAFTMSIVAITSSGEVFVDSQLELYNARVTEYNL